MLAYCDYIADRIKTALKTDAAFIGSLLNDVGKINYDLTENGGFKSTKKFINVIDMNGKAYRVTIEEMKG
jgi:hypothetical protein